MSATRDAQVASAGDSSSEIHHAAGVAARPEPRLSWLDVGCGKGDVFRTVIRDYEPRTLVGIDVIDWLDDDLRSAVTIVVDSAGPALGRVAPADRVLLVETLEHLEDPWSVLRTAARKVEPGGWLVATTPNIANLRHRLELSARGTLTAFREDHKPHVSPILPHVADRILREEGLMPEPPTFALRDIIPKTGGRPWPEWAARRLPKLLSMSVVIAAQRPRA